MPPDAVDFNDALCSAIDETIVELLGRHVLDTVYVVLKVKYDVKRDELPYRLDTLYQLLGNTFPARPAGIIGTRIARKFYAKIGLSFNEQEGHTLLNYVEDAKARISKS